MTASSLPPGVTVLLSLTVFLNQVAANMPETSEAVPLLGNTEHGGRAGRLGGRTGRAAGLSARLNVPNLRRINQYELISEPTDVH